MKEIYVSLSGAVAQERNLAIISNNLANTNTVGFKKDLSIFEAFPPDIDPSLIQGSIPSSIRILPPDLCGLNENSYTHILKTATDFSNGILRETKNPFDLAIDGEGFFAVRTSDGIHYTRKGNFVLNKNGEIVTQNGNPVLDASDSPIRVEGKNFRVSSNGEIWVDEAKVGEIKIVKFDNPSLLEKVGNTEFKPTRTDIKISDATDNATVRQGMLEYSNVSPLSETVEMINTQYAFNAYQKLIKASDEMTDGLIRMVLIG